MDIVENSIEAKATRIFISIDQDMKNDLLVIEIKDNGKGMNREILKKAVNPFFTTRNTRKVGLGLSLLKQATRECGGTFKIKSEISKGTSIKAIFQNSHIDRKPLGDLNATLVTLIAAHPEINFIVDFKNAETKFYLDTEEVS
ncbi:sensor histidine kinase [candidate division KSB1 bacterium]|nr:sensor histidine kinase [candidate division KSB1 bacterium]